MKKYFDFNGTINGLNYFLRGLLAGIPLGIMNVLLIDNPAASGSALALFFLLLIPSVWFSLSTTNKRLNALMPDQKVVGWILCFIPIISWGMSIYLLFGNSKIEKHEG